MSIDQINIVPIFTGSGNQNNVLLLDFGAPSTRRQPNTVPCLRYLYFTGAIGDDVQIWARFAQAAPNTESVLIAREDADPDGAEETNFSRFCYPIPVDPNTSLPMELYLTKTNATTPAAAFTVLMGWSDMITGNR